MALAKGDMYWYTPSDKLHGNLTLKTRPVVVVSHSSGGSTTIATVVPLTTKIKGNYINEVIFYNGNHVCVALCNQIRTINITDLTSKIGRAPQFVINKIDEALCYHLGLKTAPDELIGHTIDNGFYFEHMDYTPQSQVKKSETKWSKAPYNPEPPTYYARLDAPPKASSKTRTYTKWTEEKDKRMFQICCKEGIEAAAKEFGVSTKTIQKRFYSIRKRLSASRVT